MVLELQWQLKYRRVEPGDEEVRDDKEGEELRSLPASTED